MLKKVLWVAAACAAVLAALAVSRMLDLGGPPPSAETAPAAEEAAEPAVEVAPAPVESPPVEPPPTPEEQQILDDAAATGMTTIEPEPAPVEAPPT
jgi:hypothetical protein